MKSKAVLAVTTVAVIGFSVLSNVALLNAKTIGVVAMFSITSIFGLVGCIFVGKAWADYF